MERIRMGPLSKRRRSSIADGTLEEPGKAGARTPRSGRRTAHYGLALLFVALGVGLAAALFLTLGNAHAALWLVGAGAAF